MDSKLLRLFDALDALGVDVEYCELPSDRDGDYDHASRHIRIQHDLPFRRYRSAIAHETAHAVFGDAPSRFGPVKMKQERRADEWAALQLIDLEEYRQQERRHDGHVEAMAIALAVTVELVETFRNLLLRVGDTVYVGPRMGVGGYLARVEVA
ncbi:ImmA/IrrE family metallo-endopeptidase [Microbacterium sp.]|uniref:ImmA/IrrE family metallo-endopeptidase n=1 Tax=Microbacterium sp. TaxID=51671 RepID=UPI003A901979